MSTLAELQDPTILETEAEGIAKLDAQNSKACIMSDTEFEQEFNRIMAEGCDNILSKSDAELDREIGAFCKISIE